MTNGNQSRPVLNGRYELHRRIARGGMADVYLARDQLLDRPVAVKVLFAQFAAEPSFVARFRREAQAAGKLNHPNIVAVYDWGEHEDTYFIVMEYVEGNTLADMIKSEGSVDPAKAARLASDVAGALGFAHRNGTVHRDVKPGNIMITTEGQVKVADFGIARAFGVAEDELTQTGSVMGTASYFSPEQAQGKNVDPRSDLYALGVVLFEMLTGSTPFVGDTPVAVAYKHVQEQAPFATEKNPAVPKELAAVVNQLLQKDPRARYPAAAEIQTDLANFLAGRPLVGLRGDAMAAVSQQNQTQAMPATQVMDQAGGSQSMQTLHDTGSIKAVIDTSRAIPVTAAGGQAEALEEYYEPPNRSGAFIVMLGILAAVLVGLIGFIIVTVTGDSDPTEVTETTREVPDVIGQELETALLELETAGFEVMTMFQPSDEQEPGLVFATNPAVQSEQEIGTTIVVFVSQEADELIEIPNLAGVAESEARQRLADLGITNFQRNEENSDEEIGTVVRTEPGAGEEWDPASDGFSVVISLGPAEATVPDVAGQSVTEAQQTLDDAGFSQVLIREADAELVPSDLARLTAVRTEPAAGEDAGFDSEIEVFLSSGDPRVIMPNLAGNTRLEAEEILIEAGFLRDNFMLTSEFTNDASLAGRVISQTPAAGFPQNINDPITFAIGVLNDGTPTTPTTTDNSTSSSSSSSSASSSSSSSSSSSVSLPPGAP